MRKYLASLFCACTAFAFVGCGNQEGESAPAPETPAATAPADEKPADAAPAAEEKKEEAK
jgi:hypothetical protein